MNISRSEFLVLFDEFCGVPDRKINLFLEFAQHRLEESVWGKCYKEAVYYLGAHLIASTGGAGGSGGGVAGPITSESVGQLSRSYGQMNLNGAGNDEIFMLTKYGQLFLQLRRSCVISATVTRKSFPGSSNGQP